VGLTPLPMQDQFNAVSQAVMNAKLNGRRQFEDSTGICFLGAQDLQLLIDCVNAATGWDLTIKEALDIGVRTVNQLRVFNFRHGLHKDLEAPSTRYGSTPVDGPAQGKNIMPFWDELRSKYYAQMGWDPDTGKPTLETLERLGLGHTFTELK